MAFFNIVGISDALATTAATPQSTSGNLASLLPMLIIFVIGAYFLMIRPQNKRAKEHRKLMSDLSKGDEVVTVGGIIGKIVKLTEEFMIISVAENVDIRVKKNAIANVLPKGTIKSID